MRSQHQTAQVHPEQPIGSICSLKTRKWEISSRYLWGNIERMIFEEKLTIWEKMKEFTDLIGIKMHMKRWENSGLSIRI